ncbi:MAG: hypothetical protein AAB360_01670 [Patescibacteria group bacterium]
MLSRIFKRKRPSIESLILWTKVKRIILGSVAISALLLAVAAPRSIDQGVQANTQSAPSLGTSPRFNFLGPAPDGSNQGDLEMLRVSNVTKRTDWVDPVSADIGDEVAFLLYFHNGVPGTVAHQTSVRVDIPSGVSNQIVAASYLWSQETPYITDTVVPGLGTIGLSGGTINLNTPARVEYMPGSTKLMTRDLNNLDNLIISDLPDGIATNSYGISIGDIAGCWQYSGFVYFKVKVLAPAQLVMDKFVSPAAANPDFSLKETEAAPGGEAIYRLRVRNDGQTVATNVAVVDHLPPLSAYVPGSLQIKDINGNLLGGGETIFTGGLALPDVLPGPAGLLTITYRVKLSPSFPAGWSHLVNLAILYVNNIEQDRDQATIHVFVGVPNLKIDKTVIGGPTFRLNDIVTYKITIANTGSADLPGLVVRDIIPKNTIPGLGSVRLGGQIVPSGDDIFTPAGLALGTIPVGTSADITLQVKIIGCPNNGEELINTAYASAQGIAPISSSAAISVIVPLPAFPDIIN